MQEGDARWWIWYDCVMDGELRERERERERSAILVLGRWPAGKKKKGRDKVGGVCWMNDVVDG